MPEASNVLTTPQKFEMPTAYAKTADSIPGGAAFAYTEYQIEKGL